MGFLPSGLKFEEPEVDRLWAVCEGGYIQGETKQAAETQESRRDFHLVLQADSLAVTLKSESGSWAPRPGSVTDHVKVSHAMRGPDGPGPYYEGPRHLQAIQSTTPVCSQVRL